MYCNETQRHLFSSLDRDAVCPLFDERKEMIYLVQEAAAGSLDAFEAG